MPVYFGGRGLAVRPLDELDPPEDVLPDEPLELDPLDDPDFVDRVDGPLLPVDDGDRVYPRPFTARPRCTGSAGVSGGGVTTTTTGGPP
jgi:hypothetical protein